MPSKFFQFKKNLFLAILLLVIFVLPSKVLAENLLTVGSASSSLSGTDSAIFANIGSISATTTSLIRLQKNGVDLFKVDSTGNVTMGNFLTSINASNVSNGAFGSLSGGGNYSFPANVGIGTMTPAARLNIYSTSSIEEMFRLSDASGSSAANKYINWYSNNGGTTLTDFARIGAGYGSDYINSFMAFSVADGARVLRERVRINVNGNVGIGTTAPYNKLDVEGKVGARSFSFQHQTNPFGASSERFNLIYSNPGITNGLSFMDSAGSLRMWIGHSTIGNNNIVLNPTAGNVGIGTTTPEVTLDVNGLIKMRSSQITTTSDVINKGYLDSALETLSSSTNALNYWAANGTNIYNKNTGNVGIGTTDPSVKFVLQHSGSRYLPLWGSSIADMAFGVKTNSSLITGMDFYNENSAGQVRLMARNNNNDYVMVNAMGTTATANFFGQAGDQLLLLGVGKRLAIGTNGATSLIFGTSNTERMRISANGSVGIGTTTPGSLLTVGNNLGLTTGGTIYGATPARYLDLSGVLPLSLNVPGPIKFGNTANACDSTNSGALRYDQASGQSYLCDGTRWRNQNNCGLMTDDDGNTYNTIQIGGQCWMAENINVGTTITAGASLPNTADQVIEKWCYGDNASNCSTYGGLYHYDEAMRGSKVAGARGICPAGWHIPTDAEFNILEKTVLGIIASQNPQFVCNMSTTGWQRCADNSGTDAGGASGVGKSLKAVGVGSGVGAGNDLVGFNGRTAGDRNTDGSFNGLTSDLYLWSSTPSGSSYAWRRTLYTSYSTVYRNANSRAYGFSVRCLRD